MPRYVAFLRAINLGRHRVFRKDDIRACVEAAGFTGVETHINTGNVALTTTLRSRGRVEAVLEEAFLADRGFEVPTIAFSPAELRDVAAGGDRLAQEHPDAVRHYVSLLKVEPSADLLADALPALASPGVTVEVVGRSVHVLPEQVLAQGGPQSDRLEKLLGVATTRNQTVLRDVVAKWCLDRPLRQTAGPRRPGTRAPGG